uniref:Uncharacterized protein n=1 Tax=viral metagenome TaxID=1070528 RepID=A0A6M3K9B4_9ZZZZ
MTPECAAPGAVWVAFAVGVFIVGVPAGSILAAILAFGAREAVAREAYAKGRADERAKAEGRRPILHEQDESGHWICCCGDHLATFPTVPQEAGTEANCGIHSTILAAIEYQQSHRTRDRGRAP